MTDKELRKLNRQELLEVLIALTKENEDLKAKLSAAETKASSRDIVLDEAGSIAEASLKLSGVFEAAQAAASEYLRNVELLVERQRTIGDTLEAQARVKCDAMLAATESQCKAREQEAEVRYRSVVRQLKKLYEEDTILRDMLTYSEPDEPVTEPAPETDET